MRDWLEGMDREDRKRIGEDIKLVQFRWPLGLPLVRKMETESLGNSNQSRVRQYRQGVFYSQERPDGTVTWPRKKSQKTPRQELELARTRKNQWHDEV